jgi:cell division transport system permease protein
LLAGLRYGGWVFLFIVMTGGAYIVAMAIGVRIESRRSEAEVMSLLGASSAFVRGPLMLEGAIQGAAGAGLAVLGLWLLFCAGADAAGDVLGAAFGSAPVVFLPAAQIGLAIAAGAAIGAVGSWLATRRYAALC